MHFWIDCEDLYAVEACQLGLRTNFSGDSVWALVSLRAPCWDRYCFLIFINVLPIHLTQLRVTLFADDTSVIISALMCEELQSTCERPVGEFVQWCRVNGVKINLEKTVCIYVFRSKKH